MKAGSCVYVPIVYCYHQQMLIKLCFALKCDTFGTINLNVSLSILKYYMLYFIWVCFHKQIVASSNRVKTAWKIIKGNSGNFYNDDTITKINCGNMSLENPKEIANAFNKILY